VIRTLGVLLTAGLLLSACGSISGASAMTSWVVQSGYVSNAKALAKDAAQSANALRSPSTSTAGLHTVCGVMDYDAESLNASLPTPDTQSTNLLAKALNTLGAAANECYDAGSSVSARAKALATDATGVADLAEASARITSAATP
jgi:hypothetical protein